MPIKSILEEHSSSKARSLNKIYTIYLFIGGLQLYNIGILFGPLSDLVQHDTSVPLEMKTSHSLF